MMEPTTTPGIDAVGQVHVNVRDLPRAVAFYRDVLGLRCLFEIPGSAFFDAGNLRLMIGIAEGLESDHPASVLYYRVPDIHAAFASVRRSAQVEAEPHLIARMPDHELWMAFLRDPEGNLFALMSELRER
jgi:methylmalonyl-CoA/ethylmalonyl-CoA epimerase